VEPEKDRRRGGSATSKSKNWPKRSGKLSLRAASLRDKRKYAGAVLAVSKKAGARKKKRKSILVYGKGTITIRRREIRKRKHQSKGEDEFILSLLGSRRGRREVSIRSRGDSAGLASIIQGGGRERGRLALNE